LEPRTIIFEPAGRNTAAAIALAALEADTDELLLVMPSDHVIAYPDRFLTAVAAAVPHAQAGHLLTFGIEPAGPETGYGYIKRGALLGGGAFAVARFVEKPDRGTAEHYLAEGGYYWNGGIFLFRADGLLAALEAHAPDILADVRRSLAAARREGAAVYPEPQMFGGVRSQSIDHAVMEVAGNIAMVPVGMGWSDVGSWDTLYEVAAKDTGGNAVSGDVHAHDSRNCLLHSEGPVIVAAGVENLIVVAAAGAVLILPRGQSQRVKELVERLPAGRK
jgi:mannose-1-phosphate guanylyltransferase